MNKEHLFALQQAIDGYEFYRQKTLEYDKQIEKLLHQFTLNLPLIKLINPKPSGIINQRLIIFILTL